MDDSFIVTHRTDVNGPLLFIQSVEEDICNFISPVSIVVIQTEKLEWKINDEKHMNIPLVLQSSTRKISFKREGGERMITEYTVRSNTLQCSLKKGTTTLTVGREERYFFFLQL